MKNNNMMTCKLNQYDVSGILMTYSMKARTCTTDADLKKLIKDLKQELNLKNIMVEK